jgi:2-polyprenyl-6-methoxyphenol hydroxylase-like FAD-dependent oxidoreductase
MRKFDLVFAGGGIGGLTAGAIAAKLGRPYLILEQAKSYEKKGSGLSIMGNAILALREFGLDEFVCDLGAPIRLFEVRDNRGRKIFQVDFNRVSRIIGAPSICIHRSDLQNGLLGLNNSSSYILDKKVQGFEISGSHVSVKTLSPQAQEEEIFTTLLVGSDGLRSEIRRLLENEFLDQIDRPTPLRSAGFTAWLATIPFSHKDWRPGSVIHYWGEGKRVGLVDIGKGQLYWWITMNDDILDRVASPGESKLEALREVFKDWPQLVQDALEQTPQNQEIIQVETQDRRPRNFWGSGPVSLLGDAAHPSLTSLGQGAGMAIEDAVILMRELREDFSFRGLRIYEGKRRVRTSQVVRLSRNVATYEQFRHPLACWLRNSFFRALPQAVVDSQMESLIRFGKDHL